MVMTNLATPITRSEEIENIEAKLERLYFKIEPSMTATQLQECYALVREINTGLRNLKKTARLAEQLTEEPPYDWELQRDEEN